MAINQPPMALNVRLKPDLAQQLQDFTQAYDITATEAVRMLLQRALDTDKLFAADGVQVEVNFKEDRVNSDTEYFGRLNIAVTVPESMQAELGRVVFTLPEFTDSNDFEPYRVDNAHFLRVTLPRVAVDSKTRTRAVLTFRLLKGKWVGSVYRYSETTTREEMLKDIQNTLSKAITQTLRLKLFGLLPPEREMTDAEYADYARRDSDIKFY